MTEHDIQNAIRLELSKRGYMTERINVGSGFLVPSRLFSKVKLYCPKFRKELDNVQYFNSGAIQGRSDLDVIKDGRIYFIEVKDETGRPRPDQIKFIETVSSRYGCPAGIARSVDDALKIVGEV